MDIYYNSTRGSNFKEEFETYLQLFKQNCENTDYEFGEKVWNELCKFSYIECNEEECLNYYHQIVELGKTFNGANCLELFIKAHVAFRKWKREESKNQRGTGWVTYPD